MSKIKKKEDIFYQLYIEFCDEIIVAGETFKDLMENYVDIEEKVANMKALETQCDTKAHEILRKLHESFITPFDREDIYSITREMDEVVDSMEEVSNRFYIFNVTYIREEALDMADLILKAIREMRELFVALPNLKKNTGKVMEKVISVNKIENDGDVVYRDAMKTLFSDEKNPIELIKWKHIFEQLEESLDACETVANIIEGVVMKYV